MSIPIGTIQPAAPNFLRQHDFNINADFNAGHHQLRGRLLYDRQRSPNVNPDTPLAQFSGDIAADSRKVIFSDAWTASPSFANDFRLSYSRFVQGYTVPQQFTNFPNVIIDNLGLNIGSESNSPQSYTQNNYQFLNNITLIRGAHALKFGVEWRHWIAPTNFLPRARGEWDYSSLQALIDDRVPDGFNGALRGAGSGVFSGNQDGIYWFVQDDWKIAPRLTLNLGLRYEWMSNPRDAQLQTLNSLATLPGVFEFRVPKTNRNNFAPRIGFAWDPFEMQGPLFGAVLASPMTLHSKTSPLCSSHRNSRSSRMNRSPALDWQGCRRHGVRLELASGRVAGCFRRLVPPQTVAEARAATGSLIVDTVQPKVLTWTLGVQRELARNTSLELRYLGTRAHITG